MYRVVRVAHNSLEREMKFTYTEHKKHTSHQCTNVDECQSPTHKSYTADTVIFVCNTDGISEADKLFQAATGKDPTKTFNIGCTVG